MASTVPVRRPPTPELVRETRLKQSTLAAKKTLSAHVDHFKPRAEASATERRSSGEPKPDPK